MGMPNEQIWWECLMNRFDGNNGNAKWIDLMGMPNEKI